MSLYETDVAIIGAGPSGLFTVFEAGFLGYKSVVIDALPEIGGQLTALYPDKPIYDVPGYPHILAGELVDKLVEQASAYEPMYLTNSPVQQLEKNDEGVFTLTAGEHTVTAKVVVIAGGGGAFTPRKPKLADLEAYENSSVFYAVRDKQKFANQHIMIAGGGDSAVDWAVALADVAVHVHVVHRRMDFRAAEATVAQMQELVEQGKVTLHQPCQPQALHGENGQLSAVTVADVDGAESTVNVDSLLCFYGLAPNLGPIADWGLQLDKRKVAVDAATMKTNVDGILVVGDMAQYPGKLGLILTGFAEAAIAAKTVQSIINPEKKFKVSYSTSVGVPGQTK